jgi:pimeloyl-ACP methyl ester carboxylesterase
MLEVIEKGPCRESDKPPVLFVHGAWHGAWCWDEHFLDFFAEKGYRSLAVSLRGHGKSTAPKHIRFCSIADFGSPDSFCAGSSCTRGPLHEAWPSASHCAVLAARPNWPAKPSSLS